VDLDVGVVDEVRLPVEEHEWAPLVPLLKEQVPPFAGLVERRTEDLGSRVIKKLSFALVIYEPATLVKAT
jgi:hypothetical protein